MPLHEWWDSFGDVANLGQLTGPAVRALTEALSTGRLPGATLVGIRRRDDTGQEALHLEIDVERPQDIALPIKASEPIAIVFQASGGQPTVLALRPDFPDTMHQNWTPTGAPLALCVDDRPWQEAQLTTTPADLVRRIQLWLAKAACGELHDPAQPLDPLFFRNQLRLVIPASILTRDTPPELAGFRREDNEGIVIADEVEPQALANGSKAGFIALTIKGQPRPMARLRHAPDTLSALAQNLAGDVDVRALLAERLRNWAGLGRVDLRRLQSHLIIIVAFPVTAGEGRATNDLRAFVTHDIVGEVGVRLGVLMRNESGVGNTQGFVSRIGAAELASGDDVKLMPMDVHTAFDRDMATAISGSAAPDRRKAVLVGAGALGSQLAFDLAREGRFEWAVVDQDVLLPHNLARHVLLAFDVGAPKARAVGRHLEMLLNEPVQAFTCDVAAAEIPETAGLLASLAQADVILDASASVATSRFLSDFDGSGARRQSVFFNPTGTAVVILSESRNRSVTLRDLEAQYHALLQSDESLAGHLRGHSATLRYSGSCRALTNRIPASQAALLSALAAKGVVRALGEDGATIRIWTSAADGSVSLREVQGQPVTRLGLGEWTVCYNAAVMELLTSLRAAHLPAETGGVLLGITDVSRRSIHIVHALPAPPDSVGTATGFERGVVGLQAAVTGAVANSLHQVRYIGEWHSHPAGASARPSSVDAQQLKWLSEELAAEGLPAVMAIAAAGSEFGMYLGRAASAGSLPSAGSGV
jgi:integrative and conjugative element protein (TIGR02256 family)